MKLRDLVSVAALFLEFRVYDKTILVYQGSAHQLSNEKLLDREVDMFDIDNCSTGGSFMKVYID